MEVEEADTDTNGLTEEAVMVTAPEVALSGEAQGALDVITTITWSPSASVLEVYVAALVPAVTPLVGVAVKVTDCPEQMEVDEADTTTNGLTEEAVMVTAPEVALSGEAQEALDVITTITWSPSASVLEVYVAALVPAFTQFTFHW